MILDKNNWHIQYEILFSSIQYNVYKIRPILHFCRLIFVKKSQFQVNFEHFGDIFLIEYTTDKCQQFYNIVNDICELFLTQKM